MKNMEWIDIILVIALLAVIIVLTFRIGYETGQNSMRNRNAEPNEVFNYSVDGENVLQVIHKPGYYKVNVIDEKGTVIEFK